jgi:hypothetical protein
MFRQSRAALVALAVTAALLFAACATTETISPTPSSGGTGPSGSDGPLPSWLPSADPGASEAPSGGQTPEPGTETAEPTGQTPEPGMETPEPGTATPEPTGEPSPAPTPGAGAAACTGTVDNRTFFEHIAGQVDWDLYCAVLPPHWFVDAGEFSLRDGGRMEVTYRGPGGARLTLQEGNFCTDGVSACSPKDQSLGEASFGSRGGGLVSLGPGDGFAVYVDPGQAPSWAATGTGLDQATFVAFAAALYLVAP